MKISKNLPAALLFGVAATAATVLFLAARTKIAPLCGAGEGCARAAADAWARIGPVPAGLAALGWLWLAAVSWGRGIAARALASVGFVAAAAYAARSFAIGAFCPWCLALQLSVAALSVLLYRHDAGGNGAISSRLVPAAVGVALALFARPILLPIREPYDVAAARSIGFAALDRPETRLGSGPSREVWFVSLVCPICRDKLDRALAGDPPDVSLRFFPDRSNPVDLRLTALALGGGTGFADRLREVLRGEIVPTADAVEARRRFDEDVAYARRLRISGVPAVVPRP